jgi:hypothetical protein
MKKFFWLLTTILIVSCSRDDNNEALYETYGVVKEDVNTSGKLYVRSDNGKVILPLSNFLSNDDRDRRVWMRFFTGDNVNSDTVKVNIHEFLIITNMADTTQPDESKSDVVYLKNIGVAQDYLTMQMTVMAGSESSLQNHKYTMYSDWKVVNDTVRMEFKYNRNNDALNVSFTKLVALKLDDKITLAENANQAVLAIKYLSSTNSIKEIFVTYRK